MDEITRLEEAIAFEQQRLANLIEEGTTSSSALRDVYYDIIKMQEKIRSLSEGIDNE